jgi:hypothetical protein
MEKCPICKTESQREWLPFCSKRCKEVDLGRWLSGSYVVPGEDGTTDIPSGQPAENDN